MNALKSKLPQYYITVNGRPYLGESDETADAAPRSRIKLGEFLSGPGKIIISRRNLRSELERIFAEADAGLDIEKLEITRP